MFSVGMGIGLMFWASPTSVPFGAPPHGMAEPQLKEAALVAMQYAHLLGRCIPGLFTRVCRPWRLPHSSYRRDLPTLISSAFHPLPWLPYPWPAIGRTIDVLAIIATLFGTATLLGLGAQQINSGTEFFWDTGELPTIAPIIIAVLTVFFILSAVSGVGKGIQFLSRHEHAHRCPSLAFPGAHSARRSTISTRSSICSATTSVISSRRPSALLPSATASGWQAGPSFHWAWWISPPSVAAAFIARISRGRTIREFVIGVLLIPSAVTFVWFTIMGRHGAAFRTDGRRRSG